VSVDPPKLAQGLGLPVDRVDASMTSNRYLSSTSRSQACVLRRFDVLTGSVIGVIVVGVVMAVTSLKTAKV